MEYLESTKGHQKLNAQWEVIRRIQYEESNVLFYIDTEFVDNCALVDAKKLRILMKDLFHESAA